MNISRLCAVLISIGIFLTGCASSPTPTAIPVSCEPLIIKCKVPHIPKSELETVSEDAPYDVKLKVILNNCLKIQAENELLRKALESCE